MPFPAMVFRPVQDSPPLDGMVYGLRTRIAQDFQSGFATGLCGLTAMSVEHVFGEMKMWMGNEILRSIGFARARFWIGMRNLMYNFSRFVSLKRPKKRPKKCPKPVKVR